MRPLKYSAIVLGVLAIAVSFHAPQWAGPGGPLDEPGPPPRELPADELGRRLRDLGYTSVPIERLRAGYVAVRAEIGGRAVRLILDTGSPISLLDRVRTEALKLAWDEDPVPGQARELSPMWDHHTRCEIPALAIGGAQAERVTFCRMIAESTNRALSAVGDPQVDGLLGGDVLTAVGALIDYADGRLYVRAGSARARSAIGGELEFATRDVRLPTGSDPDRVKGWDKVRIYVSSDRGKTWASAGEYAPSASEVRYQAPRDGEYWVAAQFVRTDGRAEPAGPEGLTARWKVRVETTRPSVRPDPPPADLREEAIALRREVERLRQRVRDLEAGKR